MFSDKSFQVIKGLADALVDRQGKLSHNLANVGNENYVRKDVDFGRVLGDLKSNMPTMEKDNKGILNRATYTDNNKVSLESELSKLYDNHVRYSLVVRSINHHFDHIKKALEVRAS